LLSHHFHVIFPLASAIILFEWLGYWMFYALNLATGYGPVAGLTAAVAFGLSVGLGYWLLSGLFQGILQERIEDQDRRVPNQGIRRSFHNSLIMGSISGGIIGVIAFLDQMLASTLNPILYTALSQGMTYHKLIIALNRALSTTLSQQNLPLLAISGGLFVCMAMGGLTTWRHYIIRLLLWRSHTFPGRAPQFLNDACARFLLRRVGGGYSFIHRLLLEYFVSTRE